MVTAVGPAAGGLVLVAAALMAWPDGQTALRARVAPMRSILSRVRWRSGVILAGGAMAVAVIPAVAWGPLISLGLIVATGARLLGRTRRRGRSRRDSAAVATALAAMIRELEIGIPPAAAAARIAADQPSWLARLLTGSVAQVEPGHVDPELVPVAERLWAATELSAQHGIALAVVLGSLVRDLKDRAEAGARRAAQTAGPVMSGYVLAALPAAGIALGAGMGADPVGVLVGSALGGVLLVAGVTLTCAGLLWADRIAQGRDRG